MKPGFRILIFLSVFALGLLSGIGVSHLQQSSDKQSSASKRKETSSAESPGAITLLSPQSPPAGASTGTVPSSFPYTSPTDRPGVSTDTLETLRTSIKDRSTKGKLQYLYLLQQLTTEDAPKMIAVLRELSQQGYSVGEYDRLLWERWAEVDGKAASTAMFERDKRFRETYLSKLAISTWARNDPDAASEWLLSQDDIPLREGMIKGLIEGMAESDPAAAQRFLTSAQLSDKQREHGYSEIARQHQVQKGIDAVGAWYQTYSEDDPAFNMVVEATTRIYSHATFADALNWGNSLGDSSETSIAVRERLHARLAYSRPDGLLTYLAYTPGAEALTAVGPLTQQAVARWTTTNPNAMGNWLNKNSDMPNYDLVAVPFVEQIANQDPEAARAWTETIRDADIRKSLTDRLPQG